MLTYFTSFEMESLMKCIYWRSTLSWWKSLSYRNQSIDFLCKSMNWFLYGKDLRRERVNGGLYLDFLPIIGPLKSLLVLSSELLCVRFYYLSYILMHLFGNSRVFYDLFVFIFPIFYKSKKLKFLSWFVVFS